MNSIKFPDMFTSSSTLVVKDREASSQDLKLLLNTEKGEFINDPFFGVKIKRYFFNQNNVILKDVIIDEIYTQLKIFAPQLVVNRDDIFIEQKDNKIFARINAINKLDYTSDMYNIVLLQNIEG